MNASSPACNGILRFSSGMTPADFLAASMAAKPFSSTYLRTSISGTWDQDLLPHSVRTGRRSTDWAMPARLFKFYYVETCFNCGLKFETDMFCITYLSNLNSKSVSRTYSMFSCLHSLNICAHRVLCCGTVSKSVYWQRASCNSSYRTNLLAKWQKNWSLCVGVLAPGHRYQPSSSSPVGRSSMLSKSVS